MKRLILAILLLSTIVLAPAGAAERELCRFHDATLAEISGLATSTRHEGVVWAHNDSGGGPYLYAVDTSNCSIAATITIANSEARDYEAIAMGNGSIWLADIGDNLNSWENVELLKIKEPRHLGDTTVTAMKYRFTYEDMPHDAEALLVDPKSDQVWIITKQIAHGSLYKMPNPMSASSVNIAKKIKRQGGLVTDAAIAPNGTKYVVRDYVDARVYEGLPPGKQTTYFPLPLQLQGEAVTWTVDSSQLIIASERDRALLLVDVPAPTPEPTPAPTQTVQPEPTPTPTTEPNTSPTTNLVPVIVASLGVFAVLGVVWLLRRNRMH